MPFPPEPYYAAEIHACDVLTGPQGTHVRIFTRDDDPDSFYEGVVAERVVMRDRLEAVVLQIEGLPRRDGGIYEQPVRITVPWDVVEALIQLPQEDAP